MEAFIASTLKAIAELEEERDDLDSQIEELQDQLFESREELKRLPVYVPPIPEPEDVPWYERLLEAST